MKKNVIIRSGTLRMGGLERILIEMLQNISKQKYNIFLIIEDDSGDDNVFLDQVPTEFPIYFLKDKGMIEKKNELKKGRKSLFNKIGYDLYRRKEHQVAITETKKVIVKMQQQYGSVDVFLDFDWGARRYAEQLDAKKKIIWIHNSLPKLLKKQSKIQRFGHNLDKYDTVVAICDDMKREIQDLYPYLQHKVERIYNPFNFDRILTLASDTSVLNASELELIKQDYILAVSRLDVVQKDYDTLLHAYKLALEKGVKEKLYIIGDGEGETAIKAMIENYSLQDSVYLVGRKVNPYVWMKHAQLFVHSSFYEGLPTVLIEAMICGKVVVSTDCPTGPYEILQGGEVGMLSPVKDFSALSNNLVELLTDKEKISIYESKLHERVQVFKSQNVIKEYERVIDQER